MALVIGKQRTPGTHSRQCARADDTKHVDGTTTARKRCVRMKRRGKMEDGRRDGDGSREDLQGGIVGFGRRTEWQQAA